MLILIFHFPEIADRDLEGKQVDDRWRRCASAMNKERERLSKAEQELEGKRLSRARTSA